MRQQFISMMIALLLALFAPTICMAEQSAPQFPAPPPLNYKILEQEKHNPKAFTQGLELHNGQFYESSGLIGESYIINYAPDNTPLRLLPIDTQWFAEGLTLFNGYLFMLTWTHGIALKIEADNWKNQTILRYQGEGWGLTHDEHQLIMSNGSDTLAFINPETFISTHKLQVSGGNTQWLNINELEYARGLIWANLWQTPYIIAIAPQSGQVLGLLDLTVLVSANTNNPSSQSLNGIAYDINRNAFWITGKQWDNRYLLEIDQPSTPTPPAAKQTEPKD